MVRIAKRIWCFIIGFHSGLHIGDTCTTCGRTFKRAKEEGEMESLIERLENVGFGSLKLDREVSAAIFGRKGRRVPAYTTSLDNALLLAEQVSPGVMWWINHQAVINCEKFYHAEVSAETEIEGQEGYARTPALALCSAILKAALHSQTKEQVGEET